MPIKCPDFTSFQILLPLLLSLLLLLLDAGLCLQCVGVTGDVFASRFSGLRGLENFAGGTGISMNNINSQHRKRMISAI